MTSHIDLFNVDKINFSRPFQVTNECIDWCKDQIPTQQAYLNNEIIIGFVAATFILVVGKQLQKNKDLLPKELNKQVIYLITDGLQNAGILALVGIIIYYTFFQ